MKYELILLTIFLTSCGSGSDTPPTPNEPNEPNYETPTVVPVDLTLNWDNKNWNDSNWK